MSEISEEGEVEVTLVSACIPFVHLRSGLTKTMGQNRTPSTARSDMTLFQHFGNTGTSGQDHKQVFHQIYSGDQNRSYLFVSKLWTFQVNNGKFTL